MNLKLKKVIASKAHNALIDQAVDFIVQERAKSYDQLKFQQVLDDELVKKSQLEDFESRLREEKLQAFLQVQQDHKFHSAKSTSDGEATVANYSSA